MKNLDYYVSTVADSMSDLFDNDELIKRKWLIQYQIDSVIETIGTKQCSINIDLYLNELLKQMNEDEISNFLNRITERIKLVYNITTFDLLSVDMFQLTEDKKRLVKKLLHFFEKEGWVSILAKSLYTDSPNIYKSDKLKEFLLLNYDKFVNNIGFFRQDLPKILIDFFAFAPRDEVIESLVRIISKNKIAIVVEQELELKQKEMESNVNNQNTSNDNN